MRPGSFRLRARLLLLVMAAGMVAGCQPGTEASLPKPSPSPPLTCPGDDHSIDEVQLGWRFCYPATWHYRERAVPLDTPKGVDTTFDIVEFAPDTPDDGKFGFMIVGTYQRQSSDSLAAWVGRYAADESGLQPITWGNAQEAARAASGRRFALTPAHVIELDIREGIGNLAVENAMNDRLKTWQFGY